MPLLSSSCTREVYCEELSSFWPGAAEAAAGKKMAKQLHPDDVALIALALSALCKGLPSLDNADVLHAACSAKVAATSLLSHGAAVCFQILDTAESEGGQRRKNTTQLVSIHSPSVQSLCHGLQHILAELCTGWISAHADACSMAFAAAASQQPADPDTTNEHLEIADLLPPLHRACARHALLLLLQLQAWAAGAAPQLHLGWVQQGLLSQLAALLRLCVYEAEHCVTHPWEYALWGGLRDHLAGPRRSKQRPLTGYQLKTATPAQQFVYAVSHYPLVVLTDGTQAPPLHSSWAPPCAVATVGTSPDYHSPLLLRLLLLLRPIICDTSTSGPGAYLASCVNPLLHAGVWRGPHWEALHRGLNKPPLPVGKSLAAATPLVTPLPRGLPNAPPGGLVGGVNGRDRYIRSPHSVAARHLTKQGTSPSALVEGGSEWHTSPRRLHCFAAPLNLPPLQHLQAMSALSSEAASAAAGEGGAGGGNMTAAARAEIAASVKPQDLADAFREAAAATRAVLWRRAAGLPPPHKAGFLSDLHVTLARAVRVWLTAWSWPKECMVPLTSDTVAAMRRGGVTGGGTLEVPLMEHHVDLTEHVDRAEQSTALRCAVRAASTWFCHLSSQGSLRPSAREGGARGGALPSVDAAGTTAVLWLHSCSDVHGFQLTAQAGTRPGTVFVPSWFPLLLRRVTRGKWVNLPQQVALWQQLGEALTRQAAVMTTVCTLALQCLGGLQEHLLGWGHEAMLPVTLGAGGTVLGSGLPAVAAGGGPTPIVQASCLLQSTQMAAATALLHRAVCHSWGSAWAASVAHIPAMMTAVITEAVPAMAALGPKTIHTVHCESSTHPMGVFVDNLCGGQRAAGASTPPPLAAAFAAAGAAASGGVHAISKQHYAHQAWLLPQEAFSSSLHFNVVGSVPLLCAGRRFAELLAMEYGESSGRHEGKLPQAAPPLCKWMLQLCVLSRQQSGYPGEGDASSLGCQPVWVALHAIAAMAATQTGVLALLQANTHMHLRQLALCALSKACQRSSCSDACEGALSPQTAPPPASPGLGEAEMALRLAWCATNALLKLHWALPHAPMVLPQLGSKATRSGVKSFETRGDAAAAAKAAPAWVLFDAEHTASIASAVLVEHVPRSTQAMHTVLLSRPGTSGVHHHASHSLPCTCVDEAMLTWQVCRQASDLLCALHTAALAEWEAPRAPPLPWLVPMLTHVQSGMAASVHSASAAVLLLSDLLPALLQAHPCPVDSEAPEAAKSQAEMESALLQEEAGVEAGHRPSRAAVRSAVPLSAARRDAGAQLLYIVQEHCHAHRLARGAVQNLLGMCDMLLQCATSPLLGCDVLSLTAPGAPTVLAGVLALASDFLSHLVKLPDVSEIQWGTARAVLDAAAAAARAVSAIAQGAGGSAPDSKGGAHPPPDTALSPPQQASFSMLAEVLLEGGLAHALQSTHASCTLLQLAGGVQAAAELPKPLNMKRILHSWSSQGVHRLRTIAREGALFPWWEVDPPLAQVAGALGCTLLHCSDGSYIVPGSVGVDVDRLRLEKAEGGASAAERPSAAVAAAAGAAWRAMRALGGSLEKMLQGTQVASQEIAANGRSAAALASWRHPLLAPAQLCADALLGLSGGAVAAEVLHGNVQTHSELMRLALSGVPSVDPPPMSGAPLPGVSSAAQLVKAASAHSADGAPLRALFAPLAASSLPWAGMHEGGGSRAAVADVEGRRGGASQRLARRNSVQGGGMQRHGSWKGAADALGGGDRAPLGPPSADRDGVFGGHTDAPQSEALAPTVSLTRRASMRFGGGVGGASLSRGLESVAGLSLGASLGGGASLSDPPSTSSEAQVNLSRIGRLLWRDLASTLQQWQVARARAHQTAIAAEHSQREADAYMNAGAGGIEDGITLPPPAPPASLNVERFLSRVQQQVHLRHIKNTTDTRLDVVLELMVHLSGGLEEGGGKGAP